MRYYLWEYLQDLHYCAVVFARPFAGVLEGVPFVGLALCWQLGLFEDTALYQLKGYGNPALCLPQSHVETLGCVETRLCTGEEVEWKPSCLPATRSKGNPALCRLRGFVETCLRGSMEIRI